MKTENGIESLIDIKTGTKVYTWDFSTNTETLEPLLVTFRHEEVDKVEHYEFTTDNLDRVILTTDHNVFLKDGTMVQAKDLQVGDNFKDSSITKITTIMDTPLTPVLMNANVITKYGTVISSWNGDTSNVKLMDTLINSVKGYVDTHSTEEIENTLLNVYNEFRSLNKDKTKVPELMNKYNIKPSIPVDVY